jgi:hypothetical protein
MVGELLQSAGLSNIRRVNQPLRGDVKALFDAVDVPDARDLQNACFQHFVDMPVKRWLGDIGQDVRQLIDGEFDAVERLKNAHSRRMIDD